MKDLLDGRIAIERRADNTIALINADGTREALTPEQTAEFAMALLRAAAVDPAKHAALMQFHSIAAAQNLAAGGGDPVPQGAEFERAAAADPPGQDDDRSMRPVSPSEQPLREGLRFEGNPQNPDNAQFRSGYQPGFVGPGRGHLGGLPDEDLTFRPSSRRGLTILDINDPGTPLATDIGDRGTQFQADAGAFGLTQTSTLFEAGFVGPGLLHLEPLRNDDYRFEEARPRDRAGIREDDIAPVLGELLPNPVADAPMISVADAPMISVGSGAFSAEEDSRIALTGLSAALVDADGSETLSAIRIAGVPAGGSFCDAAGLVRGANNGDGSWSFAPSDLAGLHFQPPLNLHGAFNLTFEATSREGASGETATAASSFTITVTAEADAPVVNAGSVNLNEDVLTPIGAGIAYGLADQDGSEAVTAVRITGFPAGSSFVMPPSGGAVITALAGGFVVTGSAADIRATLDGLAVRAPANSDNEIGLVVAVTSTDADGSTAAAANTLTLTVAAVADAPVVTGAAAGAEDAFIAVPIAVALADTDGSESLSSVVVSQVPSGALLQWQSTLPGTVTGNGSGSFTFTGSTAEIQALLQSLTIRPPANSDAGFSLRVTATSTESNPSGGQVTVLNAVTAFDVPVTVTAVADQAIVPTASTTGAEDAMTAFGANISYALTDNDGSERVTAVTLSGFPAGAAVTYAAAGAASVTFAAGTYTISGPAADIRATLDSFAVRPPANSDATINIAVGVTTTDTGGVTAASNGSHAVVVDSVADTPVLQTNLIYGSTGVALPVNVLAYSTDPDGSETVSVTLTNVPAGATFNGGTNLGGGAWRFTHMELAGLTVTLAAGTANTTINVAATATETKNGATNTVNSIIPLDLSAGGTPLIGTAGADQLTGGVGNDTFLGSAGADTLNGDLGSDTVNYAASGSAVTVNLLTNINLGGDAAGDVLLSVENIVGSGQADSLTGDGSANAFSGGAGNDTLIGGAGDDTLDGGTGDDSLVGGTGNDSFIVDSALDLLIEAAGEGTDEVRSLLAAYSIAALPNVENLTFVGAGNFTGTGNTLANSITGGTGNDTLDGGTGADSLIGGLGNDVFLVDNAGDIVTELSGEGTDEIRPLLTTLSLAALPNVENLTFTGAGNFTGTGNAAANSIIGSSGNDTLDGGTGVDTLAGGLGNDVYFVDRWDDFLIEFPGEGTDEIRTSLTNFSIVGFANVENLTYTGAGNIFFTGNTGANSITGGAGNDALDGGAGADTLVGGLGNDSFLVDNVGDVVTELAGQGTDQIRTSRTTYSIAALANVENLTFTGSGNFSGTGNTGANSITGGAGSDALDGGAGADTLVGGLGNDAYIVDNASDVVTELAGQGTDEIRTTLTTLSIAALTNVENLTYTGASAFTGTGNASANSISGGSGNDTLNGGTGADTLIGWLGNDVYLVDNAGDVVTELAGRGTDVIRTTLTSYSIGALTNIENLTFTGAGNFTGTGNTAANSITGGAGNDTLDGDTGADTLVGGLGNDIYIVDVAGDVVTEAAGQGTDEIRTSLTAYSIAALANVENLTYTGPSAFTGTGNLSANSITGSSGNDTLNGSDGNDSLIGGTGNDSLSGGNNNDLIIGGQGADTLNGGSGIDTFRYLAGDTTGGPDLVISFTAGAGGDVIDIDALLPLYDNNPLTLANYVNLFESGGNTSLIIDAAGASNFTTTVLTLQAVIGLDLNSLRTNGNLVT